MKSIVYIALLAALAYGAWEFVIRDKLFQEQASHGDIIVYTSNSCGLACSEMVEAIRGTSEHVFSLNVDEDSDIEDELAAKLEAVGFDRKIYRMPVVDVFGEVLADGPPIKRVMEAIQNHQ